MTAHAAFAGALLLAALPLVRAGCDASDSSKCAAPLRPPPWVSADGCAQLLHKPDRDRLRHLCAAPPPLPTRADAAHTHTQSRS
jgi:hypothetical protein